MAYWILRPEPWVDAAPLLEPRAFHSATLLRDGRVLVVGGQDQSEKGILASAEVYDPSSDTWSATGSMRYPRIHHDAVLLEDGRVMVSRGIREYYSEGRPPMMKKRRNRLVEVWDPTTGWWVETDEVVPDAPKPPLHIEGSEERLKWFTVTTLPGGDTFVTGGIAEPSYTENSKSALTRFVDQLNDDLHDLDVPTLSSTEVWNGSRWRPGPSLNHARAAHTVTLLSDKRILAAGGLDSSGFASMSCELLGPDP